MKFYEIVNQVVALLQREGRVSYRALRLEFDLTDDVLEALKEELIEVKELATDKDGKMLVWTGGGAEGEKAKRGNGETEDKGRASNVQRLTLEDQPPTPSTQPPAAERRQLTVMFCDLVGSTALSAQLDPEDLREVVRQYQQTCAEVIQRHEGYLAQYLGDGLLIYFGYPSAHEDDARRAVRTGLEIIQTLRQQVPSPLRGEGQGEGEKLAQLQTFPHPSPLPQGARELQVRIGIHTGLVVIGEIGSNEKRELLALGETPNIAARVQGLAEPNTVIISAATQRLIDGQFECQPFGSHLVKGIDTPIEVYHVQSERQSGGYLEGRTTLTPLVGREQEVGLLFDRWEQVKEGRGQVVLLSGEPGIGKSRLSHTLKEQVTTEGSLLFEARCSPYHQHSALYPLIDMLQRTLPLTSHETNDEKVRELNRALALSDMQASLPLFTALLSLPIPSHYPPLNFTPQKQKERTLQALVRLLVAQAERQATVSVWEDLHWADPSSLEFLNLLVEQIPTTKLLLVLTFRPEFTPPWKLRSHITQLTLSRLGRKQVEAMIEKVVEGKSLPAEVIEQIRVKTDGVPLFVEELTKSVVESMKGQVTGDRLQAEFGIPATLQEALLARLDRLSTARQIAQLGATLGREFSYELLHAVTPVSETDLQTSLSKLVEAEILYRRGVGEHAHYFFKHALIQDSAYQSLLKSTRQQYHQQIAQVLEERFPDTKDTQPELLAYHYTEAGLIEQAIPYWQQAGQRAVQHSANIEAISYLTKGLELLKTLPDTPERAQQELTLQLVLGAPLMDTKGFAASEVKEAYARARELCQQGGETHQLFPALRGLCVFYSSAAELQTAHEIAEQLLNLARSVQDSALLVEAYMALGLVLLVSGEFAPAQAHLKQGIACYDLQQHHSRAFLYGQDSGVVCLSYAAWTFWFLGYPDQALKRSHEALTLAQDLAHPFSLAYSLGPTASLHQFRRETQAAQERAQALIKLSTDQGFALRLAWGTILQGWLLAEQGQGEEGVTQIRQGLAAYRATGAEVQRPYYLALLAETYGRVGQIEKGLATLAEAMAVVSRNGEHMYEAELYRLKGTLTLQEASQKAKGKSQKSENPNPKSQSLESNAEAEACFLKAIDIAQRQQAKSWELRASISLARLWQQQDKKTEAHKLLSEVYNWFTEGFDTKDLQEARALIEELSH